MAATWGPYGFDPSDARSPPDFYQSTIAAAS
jgi:hypothetical protein